MLKRLKRRFDDFHPNKPVSEKALKHHTHAPPDYTEGRKNIIGH